MGLENQGRIEMSNQGINGHCKRVAVLLQTNAGRQSGRAAG